MRRQVMDAMIIAAVLLAATHLYGQGFNRGAVRSGNGAAPPAAHGSAGPVVSQAVPSSYGGMGRGGRVARADDGVQGGRMGGRTGRGMPGGPAGPRR